MDVLPTRRRGEAADFRVSERIPERLTVDTARRPVDVVVVEVRGELTDSFSTLTLSSLESPPKKLLIDLTRVDFFGAAGVAALRELCRHCAATAVTLRLVAPHHLRRPLELVGLIGMFTMSSTVDDAITEVVSEAVADGAE